MIKQPPYTTPASELRRTLARSWAMTAFQNHFTRFSEFRAMLERMVAEYIKAERMNFKVIRIHLDITDTGGYTRECVYEADHSDVRMPECCRPPKPDPRTTELLDTLACAWGACAFENPCTRHGELRSMVENMLTEFYKADGMRIEIAKVVVGIEGEDATITFTYGVGDDNLAPAWSFHGSTATATRVDVTG